MPSVAELDDYLTRLRARKAKLAAQPATPWGSLEELFAGGDWFGVTTASPLQRAICRIVDGKPLGELAEVPHIIKAFGGRLPTEKPYEFALLTGIRSGKSLFAGACALQWSMTCDVSPCGPGEMPRLPIVSWHKDLAQVIYGHISGRMMAAPKLRAMLYEPPTGDHIIVRHPTGTPIEITVSAGARAGVSLVARWMVGALFDEFPRMIGEGEGVVNWDDMRAAIVQRILEGGGIGHIGSPWAPFGPAFDLVTKCFGKPSKEMCVIRAAAYHMNPVYWTPERCEEAKKRDPDAYETDVEANFATQASAMYPDVLLKRATRPEPKQDEPPLHPSPLHSYVATMDPATRGNAWTLTIGTREGHRRIIAFAKEWKGSKVEPLDPELVLAEIAEILEPYGIVYVHSDQWSADTIRALAKRYGVKFIEESSQTADTVERYKSFGELLSAGHVELPPDAQLQADMRRVKKIVTRTGFAIELPLTNDGRHCDYAPAVVLACFLPVADVRQSEPEKNTPERLELEAKREKESFLKRRTADDAKPWWQKGNRKPQPRRT